MLANAVCCNSAGEPLHGYGDAWEVSDRWNRLLDRKLDRNRYGGVALKVVDDKKWQGHDSTRLRQDTYFHSI